MRRLSKKEMFNLMEERGLDIFQVIDAIMLFNNFNKEQFQSFEELVVEYLAAHRKELLG
jgi:hypothetical protein